MCPLTLWLTWSVSSQNWMRRKKGAHTRYIHKHQPCAFVIVVMTKHKDAPFNRNYIETGQDGETLMERFVDTLLSLSREVYAFMMRNTP